ncbi:MAG: hypothetical protein NUV84_05250, partial [Candidatus Uhrbacteria bacterium]|nr:hypothetical protein [Candidatus Uhrbacteria bacterium]
LRFAGLDSPCTAISSTFAEVSLADGSTSSHLVCRGRVCIDGKCIETTIDIQQANIVLLGTKLLKELGKVFVLDCSKGKVEIL